MNREMRRLAEREERRSKQKDKRGRRSPISGPGPSGAGERGRLGRMVHFLREVRVELSRVAWPTRRQMIAFTTVTVVTTGALTGYVFLVDLAFSRSILAFIRSLTS